MGCYCPLELCGKLYKYTQAVQLKGLYYILIVVLYPLQDFNFSWHILDQTVPALYPVDEQLVAQANILF